MCQLSLSLSLSLSHRSCSVKTFNWSLWSSQTNGFSFQLTIKPQATTNTASYPIPGMHYSNPLDWYTRILRRVCSISATHDGDLWKNSVASKRWRAFKVPRAWISSLTRNRKIHRLSFKLPIYLHIILNFKNLVWLVK